MTSEMIRTLPAELVIAAAVLAAFSGVPILMMRGIDPRFGQRLAAAVMVIAAIIGTTSAIAVILNRTRIFYQLAWPLPFGPAELSVDPLAAFFTLPILIIAAGSSIYCLDYRPAAKNPRTVRKMTFFFGVLVSSMLFVVSAHSTGLFLLAWEIMALAAYFVLTTDDHAPEVRDAGTLYMICAHTSTLLLFALFALMFKMTGSFVFPDAGALTATQPLATTFYLIALFGFGFKAGIMPVHIWLPSAHANAPSHISAIMSGVILKVGIYGLIRTISFFTGVPLWWGASILVLGMVSGIVGVLYALGQHDIKRLLAYHSIENIGIILIGFGAALIGKSVGSSTLFLLGMAGSLLHVFNHATFKALLFLGAGSVIHAAGTREIDRMGGLLRHMPWTALAFLVGAVAICGLPPLNGFVSEFIIYLGLFSGLLDHSGVTIVALALAAPALALVGGLAVACFVKVFGIVFLGNARQNAPASPHEAPSGMLAAMALLAGICIIIGIAPMVAFPLLNSALQEVFPSTSQLPTLASVIPAFWISVLALCIFIGTALIWSWYRNRLKQTRTEKSATWGCGYLAPSCRMQYSASSFAGTLVDFFSGILAAQRHRPCFTGHFPQSSRFESHVPETVLEKGYLPLLNYLYKKSLPIRKLQHGHLHLYILYTFITLIILFAAGN